jgi:hypothetical protein
MKRRPPPHLPCHRGIIAVDIERSTTRTNPAKIRLRESLYQVFERSLLAGGITRRYRDPLYDRGDGILALIHPVDRIPKTVLLNPVLRTLAELLAGQRQLRIRAVIHAGEIHYDRRGCCGEALDVAFRLLDAPELKIALSASISPLALVVSDTIYRSVVRHGYDGIEAHTFAPLFHVTVAGQDHHGWVHVPAHSTTQALGPSEPAALEPAAAGSLSSMKSAWVGVSPMFSPECS